MSSSIIIYAMKGNRAAIDPITAAAKRALAAPTAADESGSSDSVGDSEGETRVGALVGANVNG